MGPVRHVLPHDMVRGIRGRILRDMVAGLPDTSQYTPQFIHYEALRPRAVRWKTERPTVMVEEEDAELVQACLCPNCHVDLVPDGLLASSTRRKYGPWMACPECQWAFRVVIPQALRPPPEPPETTPRRDPVSVARAKAVELDWFCPYCLTRMVEVIPVGKYREYKGRVLTADHIVPRSRGGSNSPENISPSCRTCNHDKASLLLSEWRDPRRWWNPPR